MSSLGLLLSLFPDQLNEHRQKQLLKQIKDLAIQQPHNVLSLLNLPKLLKIEPLPNKRKQTRRRIIVREENSMGSDRNSQVFVYAPWQNKSKGNSENQELYLNYENDCNILVKVTLWNPLKIDLILDNVDLIFSNNM